jgi:hypothetical protein
MIDGGKNIHALPRETFVLVGKWQVGKWQVEKWQVNSISK